MTLTYQISPLRKVALLIGSALSALWDFNEMHFLNPVVLVVSFSVIFHVLGALFPPIENGCSPSNSISVPVYFEEERAQS